MSYNSEIVFISKISKSGKKRVINIPSDRFKELNKKIEYYEVHLIPIELNKITEE